MLSVPILAGCSSVRVRVDARVAPEDSLRAQLEKPTYVIRASDEQVEASLVFQEFAATFEHAMEMYRPGLQRVESQEPADFAVLLQASAADLGSGVTSYPVYGSHYGRAIGPCGPAYYHSYGVVGTAVETVHYGFDHVLHATAYVHDPTGPAGRRVLWEAMAGTVASKPDMPAAMPYLTLALASSFGESTEGTQTVKFSSRNHDVKYLRQWVRTGSRPASRPHDDGDPDD